MSECYHSHGVIRHRFFGWHLGCWPEFHAAAQKPQLLLVRQRTLDLGQPQHPASHGRPGSLLMSRGRWFPSTHHPTSSSLAPCVHGAGSGVGMASPGSAKHSRRTTRMNSETRRPSSEAHLLTSASSCSLKRMPTCRSRRTPSGNFFLPMRNHATGKEPSQRLLCRCTYTPPLVHGRVPLLGGHAEACDAHGRSGPSRVCLVATSRALPWGVPTLETLLLLRQFFLFVLPCNSCTEVTLLDFSGVVDCRYQSISSRMASIWSRHASTIAS